jgi:hypothetical protein
MLLQGQQVQLASRMGYIRTDVITRCQAAIIQPTSSVSRCEIQILVICKLEYSISARISKGQGYQGFLRKRAGSNFGQKRAICVVQGKI